MRLLSLVLPLALLAPALAGSHGGRSDHTSRFKKIHVPSVGKPVTAAHALERRASGANLRFSYYFPEDGGNPTACGEHHNSNDNIVAIPIGQFSNSLCNKQIKISYKGKSTYAVINDACMECPYNALDLTPRLFTDLDGSTDAGYLWGGSWELTDGSGGGDNDHHDEPPKTTKKPHTSTTTWKPEPTTTSTTSTTTHKPSTTKTSTSTTKSSTSQTPSSTSTRTSSSQTPSSSALPSQTALPGYIGSLESAFAGLANFLLAGAQL
jgi:hypothetical protein